MTLSSRGGLLASSSFDGTIKLWDAPSGRLLATIPAHTGVVYGLALSSDGGLLASGSQDATVKLWEVPSGRLRATLHGTPVWSMPWH